MKPRAVNWLLLLALSAILMSVSGCATDDPANASVRPWNSPQGWENNSLGGMDYQHK